MVQRVEDRKPFYQKKIWSDERKQNLTYLWNISRFPEVYMPSKSKENNHKSSPKISTQTRPQSAHPRLTGAEVHTTRSVQLKIEYMKKKGLINCRKGHELQQIRQISSAR